MVRFKVVKASRLLLYAALLILAAVVTLVALRLLRGDAPAQVRPSASFVRSADRPESQTAVVFASNTGDVKLPLDPEPSGIVVEVVSPTPSPAPRPSVLIYHTHTHEAYEQVQEDPYEALEAWRTTDAVHSVVRVGEELAQRLRDCGFEVVHDVTDHEGDQLSTAYTRSLETLQSYDRGFDLYIDLHRDAYVEGADAPFALSGGASCAQLMFLIGNGNGFDEKPFYAQNLAFAQALEARVNAVEPGLCKPTLVKDGRYNQHIGVFSILVEVGHNRNTLQEALNAVPALAEGLYDLLVRAPDAQLTAMRAEWLQDAAGPRS